MATSILRRGAAGLLLGLAMAMLVPGVLPLRAGERAASAARYVLEIFAAGDRLALQPHGDAVDRVWRETP